MVILGSFIILPTELDAHFARAELYAHLLHERKEHAVRAVKGFYSPPFKGVEK